jgi:hypothetical protein
MNSPDPVVIDASSESVWVPRSVRARTHRGDWQGEHHAGAAMNVCQPSKVKRGAGEDHQPVDVWESAEFNLATPTDGLQPTKGGLDARALVPALRVAVVSGRASIDRAAAPARGVLCDVRRGGEGSRHRDELVPVVPFSRAERTAS